MASWLEEKNDPSAETLAERLARTRRPGDEFGMGGWHHTSSTIAPPDPPNAFLVLLPFIVLLVIGITVTVAALYLDGKL